jgi:hypothetical protein
MLRDGAVALALLAAAMSTAAHADPFDARKAADVAAVVTSHGASGALKKGGDSKIYFAGQAGQLYFAAHFQDCDDARDLCKTLMFSSWWTTKKIDAYQINRWNRWTLYCPAYIDSDGEPDVWYAVAVSAHTDPGDLANVVGRWMDCLSDFDSFVSDPDAFLKKNNPVDASPAAPAAPATPPAPSRGHMG